MLHVVAVRQDRGFATNTDIQTEQNLHFITLIAFGQCVYRIENESMVLEKGHFLLVPPGIDIQEEAYQKSHEKVTVEFAACPQADTPLLPMLAGQKPLKWQTGKTDYYMAGLMRMREYWSEKEAYYQQLCDALLLEMLAVLNREIDKGACPPSSFQHAARMKSHIDDRYREKITKHDLGDLLRISPNYAATLFRQVTGFTISEYLHRKRIKAAEYMLRHSRLTVQDISEALGYSDPAFFQRTFTKLTGRLPSELMAERSGVDE